MDDSRTLTTIDPHGDLILILDDGCFKVSRKALSLSSAVFSAMLGKDSKFKEASNEACDEDGIRHVPLADDDYESTEILMRVIHHQNDTVPHGVSFQLLVQIAVVCDKYALRSCISPWSWIWSQPYIGSVEKQGFESWLFLSIVFRNEAVFTRVTKHLVLNSSLSEYGKLSHGGSMDLSEGVSDAIIGQMISQRANTMESLHKLLRDKMRNLAHNKSRTCTLSHKQVQCDAFNLGCLIQAFPFLCDPQVLDDAKRSSITSVVDRVRKIGTYGEELTFHQWGRSHNTGDHVECSLGKSMLPGILKAVQAVEGLTPIPV